MVGHHSGCHGGVVLRTKYGLVEGQRMVTSGQPILSFLGIPYAKPPQGQLRWKVSVSIYHKFISPVIYFLVIEIRINPRLGKRVMGYNLDVAKNVLTLFSTRVKMSAYLNPFIKLASVLDATPQLNSYIITTNKNTSICSLIL